MSVPTLIVDDRFRWTTSVEIDELVRVIASRNPAKMSAASLKGMIKNGNAYRLSEMMIQAKMIFPAFYDMLVHTEFSVRLGAMAAFEDLAEKDRSVTIQAVPHLLAIYDDQTMQRKGDILYMLGVCGDEQVIPFLRSVATGNSDTEIREAAEDALEIIQTVLYPSEKPKHGLSEK